MLGDVCDRLSGQGISLLIADDVKDLVREKGYQPKFGARPLRRAIQTLIEDPLADYLLSRGETRGLRVEACCAEGDVVFNSVLNTLDAEPEKRECETVCH
jgi:ATP-dependent Clp protease ATP-binding subunit ClpC